MKPLSLIAERVPTKLFVRLIALQYRMFEPELRQLERFVPEGKAAVDVGVWWGPWSWWLARRASKVYAFEPHSGICEKLSDALPKNVTLYNVGLSDHRGRATLWSPSGGTGTEGRSSLLSEGAEGWVEQSVQIVPLDDFDLSGIGFVKVDVEGYELPVLRGAASLLEREHPNVLVEVEQAHHGDDDMEAVFSFLTGLGYEGSFLSRGTWHPLAQFDREEARRLGELQKSRGLLRSTLLHDGYVHNFLFVPGKEPGPGS